VRGIFVGAALLLAAATAASGDPVALAVASAVVDQDAAGGIGVSIVLAPDSAAAFAAFTKANVGRTVVLTVDGTTILSATLRDPILGGAVRVSGDLSLNQLTAIANRLSAGGKVEADVQAP
jgi:preprotein translocase subunit SecD